MAVSISTTTQALDALLKWKNNQSNTHNPQLLPLDDFIYLILTLKNIPQKGGINGARTNAHKIPLPHPLISPSSLPELCLIIDDRPNSNLTSEMAKKKIKSEGIPVTKVIKLSKLKTDYKPFEAKRKLCDSYEMFFADRRVVPLLPKLLGKQFFKKKKLPLPVDLCHKNWKEQIEKGCSSGLLFLTTGTCSVIRVAKASMERDEIIENVCAAIDGLIGIVPKKLSGVRSLHLKFSESVALPLYQSLPDIKLKIEGIKEKKLDVEELHEENDEPGSVGLVGKKRKGEVSKEKSAKKGVKRIHEVNHDDNDGKGIETDDQGSVELVGKKRKGELNKDKPTKKSVKKIQEASHDDNGGEEVETDDPGSVELVGKKRKGELNKEKSAKKSVKRAQEVNHDDNDGEEIVKDDLVGKERAKSTKKSEKVMKESDVNTKISKKKVDEHKGDKKKAKEEKGDDVNTKISNKKAKKNSEEQKGKDAKKDKKKGRLVSRA